VREFPVFVPAGDDHVAAVVTVPDEPPRGVVLLLAGTGRHNAIGSTLSARLSGELAKHGLASARLDYAGVGDSPGLVPQWDPADSGAATEQARALLDTVREALGVDRFAEVGTCYGSRVALALVADPACVGAVCLAPPFLDMGGLGRMGRQVRDRRVGSFLRSNAVLRRVVVGPARRLLRARKPAPSRTSTACAWSSSTATGTCTRTTTAPVLARAWKRRSRGSPRSSRPASSCERSRAARW
jgi:alpha-beta hydrolase superfamily lysophospholipase